MRRVQSHSLVRSLVFKLGENVECSPTIEAKKFCHEITNGGIHFKEIDLFPMSSGASERTSERMGAAERVSEASE